MATRRRWEDVAEGELKEKDGMNILYSYDASIPAVSTEIISS
jgi:hypothetical protein